MTVKSIIKNACVFLQKDELLTLVDLDGAQQANENQTKELNHLVRCLNLVYKQIASEYIPLINEEKIYSDNGVIMLNSLTKKALDILRVENNVGIRLNYKLFPNRIETLGGNLTIKYSYQPEDIQNLTNEIETFSQKITERVVAYGVAMEYSFICGLHDDASIWEKRFKDSLLIACRKKSEIRLPRRRWNS